MLNLNISRSSTVGQCFQPSNLFSNLKLNPQSKPSTLTLNLNPQPQPQPQPQPSKMKENWDLIIKPKRSLFEIDFKAIWRYRDLLRMFVYRDFVTYYRQTIL